MSAASSSHTAPPSVCPDCNGTGWKIVERDEVSGAVRCECAAAARAERVESEAGIPPLYANASFENFLLPDDNPMARRLLTEVFLAVRGYARDFPATKQPGLLLIGEPGTGKTHLAVAALKAILAKGIDGLFFDYQTLLDRIRSGYDATAGASDKEAYRVAMDKEVLLLDDLGAHRVTEWVEDTVTSIITTRCNNGKALIATTNLPDEARHERSGTGVIQYKQTLSDRIGERAVSRLFEMCRVIKMPLIEDYRKKKQ